MNLHKFFHFRSSFMVGMASAIDVFSHTVLPTDLLGATVMDERAFLSDESAVANDMKAAFHLLKRELLRAKGMVT